MRGTIEDQIKALEEKRQRLIERAQIKKAKSTNLTGHEEDLKPLVELFRRVATGMNLPFAKIAEGIGRAIVGPDVVVSVRKPRGPRLSSSKVVKKPGSKKTK